MEIPSSRLPIEPEAAAFLILQPPVVASAAAFAPPPFGRDTGRTLGPPDAMAARLPEEFLGRVARHLHPFGPRQQAQGPGLERPARRRAGGRRPRTQAPPRAPPQMTLPRGGGG